MVTCSLYWIHTWRPVKLGSVLVLHLKASQTCSSKFTICLLTWTYPSLPVWLRFWLCHAYLLDWTYTFDAMRKGFKSSSVGIWASLKNSDLIWILPYFSPKVFLKLLSGARPFFTLHSYFRQENIYLMQGVMQCMIVHEWNVRAFKFVFHLNSFYSPF